MVYMHVSGGVSIEHLRLGKEKGMQLNTHCLDSEILIVAEKMFVR